MKIMSNQINFQQEKSTLNGLAMENIINVSDCCRACLGIDYSLTPISAQDTDSIKFCDKLYSCVSEVMWLKEELPSLICSSCIERLRMAYDFKNLCLQSDHTLNRYTTHLQEDNKQVLNDSRPLNTPIKFEFSTVPVSIKNELPLSDEEPQNTEYVHLKHFLDNDEDITKVEHLVEFVTTQGTTTDSDSVQNFINQNNEQDQQQLSQQQQQQQQQQIQTITVQPKPVQSRRVKKRTIAIQVRPPGPTSEDSKRFTCTICDKSYTKNSNLKVHMRTHTGEKLFECKYCEKRFYYTSHLREHIRRHTGEKPFQCALCNKRFTVKGELTTHMKSHTGDKPYSCTCCDRRCLTPAHLEKHMRTHTREKPFSCVTCGKKFAFPYKLNLHIKTHTGEKPYVCTICSKSYTQSSHLNVHMRKHHTSEIVICKTEML